MCGRCWNCLRAAKGGRAQSLNVIIRGFAYGKSSMPLPGRPHDCSAILVNSHGPPLHSPLLGTLLWELVKIGAGINLWLPFTAAIPSQRARNDAFLLFLCIAQRVTVHGTVFYGAVIVT